MKKIHYSYYGFDNRERTIIYVPENLIGIGHNDHFTFDYNPDTLQGISLLFSKKIICEEDFIKKGWDICRIRIPLYFTKGLQKLCFGQMGEMDDRLKVIIDEKAREILDYAMNIADFEGLLRRNNHNRGLDDF